MSKKHLILPVVACLILAGCTLGKKTTKKKKKSSSVEVTSVEPTSQGGQSTPAPSSANPSSQGGGASSNTQNPSSATPSVTPSTTPSVTPSTSSEDVPPSDEWTADQISQFNSVLHYVPAYNEYTSGLAYFTDSDSGLSGFEREIEGTKAGVVSFLNGDGFVEDTSESWTDTDGDVHYVYVKEISDGYVIFDVCQYEDDGTWTYYYCYFTDGEGGGGDDDPPVEGSITINKEDIQSFVPSSSTYPTEAYSFTTDGVSFDASVGVGLKAANTSGGNYFNEQGAMQFRKQSDAKGGGTLTVKSAVSKTTITIHWFATYATEASKYHPVVMVGDSASDISTNVPCNEGTTVNGVAAGTDVKEGNYAAYNYTTTYTITGHSYFKVQSPADNAMYVKDIVIS